MTATTTFLVKCDEANASRLNEALRDVAAELEGVVLKRVRVYLDVDDNGSPFGVKVEAPEADAVTGNRRPLTVRPLNENAVVVTML